MKDNLKVFRLWRLQSHQSKSNKTFHSEVSVSWRKEHSLKQIRVLIQELASYFRLRIRVSKWLFLWIDFRLCRLRHSLFGNLWLEYLKAPINLTELCTHFRSDLILIIVAFGNSIPFLQNIYILEIYFN